jgi:hypothetical protein
MDELIATSKFSVIQLTETIEPEWFQFKDKANKVIAEMSLNCKLLDLSASLLSPRLLGALHARAISPKLFHQKPTKFRIKYLSKTLLTV